MELKAQVIKGVKWTGISQVCAQGFRFLVTAILAHLLFPEDFGVVGMAIIFTGLIRSLEEFGLGTAIIQKREITQDHLSTSLWAAIVMGIIMWLLSVIISPFGAMFFKKEIVKTIIIVSALGFIISSLGSVHRTLLVKSLDFKRLALTEIGSIAVSGTTSIALALMGFGVWSIVIGSLVNDATSTILLWIVCDWRPSFRFRIKIFKELSVFSINIVGSRLTAFFATNLDYIIIGRVLGAVFLGFYSLAYKLVTIPQMGLWSTVSRVLFPAFAQVQDDNRKLREGHLKTTKYISLVSTPLLVGLAVVAPEFIISVFGTKWVPIITPTRILCIMGIFHALVSYPGQIWIAKGRPDIKFYWGILSLITIAIAVMIGVKFGIVGVAIALTIRAISLFPFTQLVTNKLIDLNFKDYLFTLWPSVFSSVIMFSVLLTFQHSLGRFFEVSAIAKLVMFIIIGSSTYIVTLRMIEDKILDEIKQIAVTALFR